MKFIFSTSIKNIKRKPFRASLLAVIVMFLSLTLFTGAFIIISLQNGLSGYQARLGADIIVTPSSAQGHGTVDNILLQGITGNYYISAKDIEKLKKIEGIDAVSTQFYLTSAKASCCSSRVQIIGFDPETDFSIQPWIHESISTEIVDGDIVIGADISFPADGSILFYGKKYHVAAQLEKTGTGLDNAVYTNRNTIREMAENASVGVQKESLKNVDINSAASAVLIKVKDGYQIQDVADDINIHITKVKATPSQSMVSSIAQGLQGVSVVIGLLVGGIWLLSIVIMIAVFAILSNERKKEFAVMRVIGASRKMMFGIMSTEAVIIGAIGAVFGVLLSLLLVFPVSEMIKEMLSLPLLQPNVINMMLLGISAVVIPIIAGVITSLLSAFRITKNETALLLREDA